MTDALTSQAARDEATVGAIRYLVAVGLTSAEIADALRIDAGAAERVRNGGEFREVNSV